MTILLVISSLVNVCLMVCLALLLRVNAKYKQVIEDRMPELMTRINNIEYNLNAHTEDINQAIRNINKGATDASK